MSLKGMVLTRNRAYLQEWMHDIGYDRIIRVSVPNFPTEDPIVFVFLTFFLKLKNLRHGATNFSDIYIDKKEYQNLLSRTFLLIKSLPICQYIRSSF